jgi:methyl-accepting chemotaxis protein
VLTDSLILLPLADAIIKAVPEKTEEAAMTVLEKFMVVREASSNAAISARTLREQLEENNEQSLAYAADLSRSAVRKERDVIKELSAGTKENRMELQRMSDEIASGLDLLKNIEEITERSKLIAFNMSIEAARIGEKGLGFKVIIVELHKLNDQTFEFSKKVAELLNKFHDHTTRLVNGMEAKSVAVVREVESGMEAAESAVEKLIDASARTEEFTKQIAIMSESIDRDLDGVLESMQFQDITRQMIEGSMAILEDLQKTLDDCLARNEIYIDEKRKQDRFTTIKNRLVSNAKTKGEKDALMEVQV